MPKTRPRADAETLHEQIANVLTPLGLRLSPAQTRIAHMGEGFDFLGFRIQWKRKRGTSKWYVYTFIADRPIRSLKAKIELFNLSAVPVTRYRYRGSTIPSPWVLNHV